MLCNHDDKERFQDFLTAKSHVVPGSTALQGHDTEIGAVKMFAIDTVICHPNNLLCKLFSSQWCLCSLVMDGFALLCFHCHIRHILLCCQYTHVWGSYKLRNSLSKYACVERCQCLTSFLTDPLETSDNFYRCQACTHTAPSSLHLQLVDMSC